MINNPKRTKNYSKCRDTNHCNSCAHSNAKHFWIVGIALVVLLSVLSLAFHRPAANQIAPERVGYIQPYSYILCPHCQYSFFDTAAGINGSTTCPNCNRNIPITFAPNSQENLYTTPVTQICPLGTRIFSPGQSVAMTTVKSAPPISRDAVMPHGYRGVCSNCHTIFNKTNLR